MAAAAREVLVLPAFGKGHLFPCIQLCHHLAARGLRSLLVVFCTRASSIPPSLHHHPFIQVAVVGSLPPSAASAAISDPLSFFGHLHLHFTLDLEALLSSRPSLIAAVLDDKLDQARDILLRRRLPVLTFYTSGAAAAAFEFSAWKFHAKSLLPGETRPVPGLPPHLGLSLSDLARRPRPQPPRPDPPSHPTPTTPPSFGYGHHIGDRPSWLSLAEASIAFLVNTCDPLERRYLDLLRRHLTVPVLDVGPLLPDTFWQAPPRPPPAQDRPLTEWLDSKPARSVLYVSFGTEVGPRKEEYPRLAAALERSHRPFIWVVQPGTARPGVEHLAFFGIEAGPEAGGEEGYFPHGLEGRAEGRGVVVAGWAPQAAILRHPATGGFLSHCGWNSTVEAVASGVPLLTWPMRGDQYPNSKLVVQDLRVGRPVREGGDPEETVAEAEIEGSIRALMEDGGVRERARALSRMFENGFPNSSAESIDRMCELVKGVK